MSDNQSTSVNTMTAKLAELKSEMHRIREAARTEGLSAFRGACQELFETHPKLESFSWAQYTPYFCDGEPCKFGVREISGMSFGGVVWEGHELEVSSRSWNGAKGTRVTHEPEVLTDGITNPDMPYDFDMPAAIAAFEAIIPLHDFLQCCEDVAEMAFGDHVRVTVSRDGVVCDDYDHD